jgi:hypothetical protein
MEFHHFKRNIDFDANVFIVDQRDVCQEEIDNSQKGSLQSIESLHESDGTNLGDCFIVLFLDEYIG